MIFSPACFRHLLCNIFSLKNMEVGRGQKTTPSKRAWRTNTSGSPGISAAANLYVRCLVPPHFLPPTGALFAPSVPCPFPILFPPLPPSALLATTAPLQVRIHAQILFAACARKSKIQDFFFAPEDFSSSLHDVAQRNPSPGDRKGRAPTWLLVPGLIQRRWDWGLGAWGIGDWDWGQAFF